MKGFNNGYKLKTNFSIVCSILNLNYFKKGGISKNFYTIKIIQQISVSHDSLNAIFERPKLSNVYPCNKVEVLSSKY